MHKHLKLYVSIGVIILLALVVGYFIFVNHAHRIPEDVLATYRARLTACNAYPNNSTQDVIETTRLSIKLPKDIYPGQKDNKLEFKTASGTATAGWISNAGPPGKSYGATANCWAYYYEFDGNGAVDLTATSAIKDMPDYFVRFIVGPVYGAQTILYRNEQYGFTFKLPETWQGYSVIQEQWQGYQSGEQGDTVSERGPQILLRHPQWTSRDPRQDIPIMIFTLTQWNSLLRGKFFASAAPVNPRELGRNAQYVFALLPRYNYAFPTGWQEVEKILESKPLQAF